MSFIARRTCRRLARPTFPTFTRRCLSAPTSDHVRLVEVGPRDGLQNEKTSIPVNTKIDFVNRLATTGLKVIEAGSFVSPKWTPQMANSSEILEHILKTPPKSTEPIIYQFLMPNEKGLDNFLNVYNAHVAAATDKGPALNTSSQDPNAMPSAASGAAAMSPTPEIEVSIFTAATETFTRKNTNCSIAESLQRFEPLMARARDNKLRVRAYISVALGCPYEGPNVNPHAVADLAVSLLELGADIISVADTTGMGTAPRTRELLRTLQAAGVERQDLALHFHDTYGQALVNTVVGLEHGVREFDAAVAGLGGCPYSPGATGNVATEDLVHLFESLGLRTGVDIQKLSEVGKWISGEIGRTNESRAGKATLARIAREKGEGC
ncbi:3-hydroxy-3-isohexenylglutaryl-CoA/hydroxy-methylglutaryl-CoA lyase [Lasiodiplodia hormozganensis]|uniref:hydroxymethylglutaryl-CoA lyase n=2 Tax=Lasiodiplodia TaxID=66739 RepID=A0A5N5CZA1_9PEZI|nr:3-hydroxy-3-isohexenylglutaryl-CoA/hydroxy-methylglutaryl-CoA lyase [Lasiodiplodia theobromae]KAK0609200.1 3-hydroxy-3-isohexenylglutaryl-CoA/hydroxy-methylglutaryl-CoA lyase [Lasiodiplodia hormozganensis]